jgi:integrase
MSDPRHAQHHRGELDVATREELPWGHPREWPLIPSNPSGANRAPPDFSTIEGPQTDTGAVAAWFLSLRGRSRSTIEAYRKEVGRLLLWAASQGKALCDLTPTDFYTYERFLAAPYPAERWIGSGRKHSRHDPRWRPFAGPLAYRNRRYAMGVIRTMLDFLVDAGFLRYNPVRRIGIERNQDNNAPSPAPIEMVKGQHDGLRRSLSRQQWRAILAGIDQLPADSDAHWINRERTRLALLILHTLGVRISSLRARHSDLYCVGGEEESLWYWRLVVKGGKQLELPFTQPLLDQLMVVRQATGKPPYPDADDHTPIIPRLRGSSIHPMSRQALSRVVVDAIRSGVDYLEIQGNYQEARGLARATAHWLRHTAATETLRATGDLRLTADLLGHSDIRITQGYTRESLERLRGAVDSREDMEGAQSVDKSTKRRE